MLIVGKFPLRLYDLCDVYMPVGAEIQSVQIQLDKNLREQLQMWALIETDAPTELRQIRIVGTGHELDGNPGKFIGTVQTDGGALVWHIYDATVAK